MKHVSESLREFEDYKFFKLFEEEEKEEKPATDKEVLKSKEKDALAIVNKVTKDFEDFKKDAKGEILKYKEFWEENQQSKKQFTEPGDVYKLFGSDYVVGVLQLPVKTLSDGSVEGGLGASDEPEEEIIEGKEIEPKEDFYEEAQVPTTPAPAPMTEAEESKESPDVDLDLGSNDFASEEPTEAPNEKPDETPTEEPVDEPTEEPMPAEEPKASLTEPQIYLVVYDLNSGEREEIFRCGSNNVVKAFKAFYNDTFKGAMKTAIADYKQQKEEEKTEAEKSEKQKKETEKQNKVKKFLGERMVEDEQIDGPLNHNDNVSNDDVTLPEDSFDDEEELDEEPLDDELSEKDNWIAEVQRFLNDDFEMTEDDAKLFVSIVEDTLEELFDEDVDPYEAASQIIEDEDAWSEFEATHGEEYENEDELKEITGEEEDFNPSEEDVE
jgi:hypothetical protein